MKMGKAYPKLLFYTCLLACSVYLIGVKSFHLMIAVAGRNPETEPLSQETIEKYIMPDAVTLGLSLLVMGLSVYKLMLLIKRLLRKDALAI